MSTRVTPKVAGFHGLNNVVDPLRLDMSWLQQADNVDITNSSALVRMRGFTRATTNTQITGTYVTKDLQRLYMVDDGLLLALNDDLTTTLLRSGLSSAPFYFTEVNGEVFYTNGVDYGLITQGGEPQDWGVPPPGPVALGVNTGSLMGGTYSVCATIIDSRGIESGNGEVASITVPDHSSITISGVEQRAGCWSIVYVTERDGEVFRRLSEDAPEALNYNCSPDDLGMELPFWFIDVPRGVIPIEFQGTMYIAEPDRANDITTIWASLPMHFHHYDYGEDALAVPGEVRMLAKIDDVLLVGTDRSIFAYDGDKMALLAPYGVVPGWHASTFDGRLYFWTLRGLCTAMPFSNLTQDTVSVPPGVSAGAMVLEKDGARRYVVALHKGGTAFNRREP